MATFEKLKQFEPGREAKTVLLLLDVTEKVNRNGGSYCHLLLSDGEEQHTATMWDKKRDICSFCKQPDRVRYQIRRIQ